MNKKTLVAINYNQDPYDLSLSIFNFTGSIPKVLPVGEIHREIKMMVSSGPYRETVFKNRTFFMDPKEISILEEMLSESSIDYRHATVTTENGYPEWELGEPIVKIEAETKNSKTHLVVRETTPLEEDFGELMMEGRSPREIARYLNNNLLKKRDPGLFLKASTFEKIMEEVQDYFQGRKKIYYLTLDKNFELERTNKCVDHLRYGLKHTITDLITSLKEREDGEVVAVSEEFLDGCYWDVRQTLDEISHYYVVDFKEFDIRPLRGYNTGSYQVFEPGRDSVAKLLALVAANHKRFVVVEQDELEWFAQTVQVACERKFNFSGVFMSVRT